MQSDVACVLLSLRYTYASLLYFNNVCNNPCSVFVTDSSQKWPNRAKNSIKSNRFDEIKKGDVDSQLIDMQEKRLTIVSLFR